MIPLNLYIDLGLLKIAFADDPLNDDPFNQTSYLDILLF